MLLGKVGSVFNTCHSLAVTLLRYLKTSHGVIRSPGNEESHSPLFAIFVSFLTLHCMLVFLKKRIYGILRAI